MKKLILILFALGLLASSNAFSYNLNSSELPFVTNESFIVSANESAQVLIEKDGNWLSCISEYNMSGQTSFVLDVMINVPADAPLGNSTSSVLWKSLLNGSILQQNTTYFHFNIFNGSYSEPFNQTNQTNETQTNATIFVPKIKFTIKDSADNEPVKTAIVNLTGANYTSSQTTGSNGIVEFEVNSSTCYDYYIFRSHYYSENGQVCIGNETLDKTILMDFIESDLGNALLDSIENFNRTQTTIATIIRDNSVTALEMRVSDLETQNQNKDIALATQTERLLSLSDESARLMNLTLSLQNQQEKDRFWGKAKGVGISIISISGVFAGMFLRNALPYVLFSPFG